MLTEAIIQTSTPTSLKIDDADPDEILVLQSISGLSDVKVTQFMGDFAREGGYYQGRRADPRNPVFNFKIQENYTEGITPNKVRELMYRMFMEPQRDSDQVQVLLKDDELPDRYFIGYTETINAPMWEKETLAQCSLRTTDAYLRSALEVEEQNPLGWFSVPVKYEGSADTGLSVIIRVDFYTPSVHLTNGPDAMVLNGPFEPGTFIQIVTTPGTREVTINGEDRINALTPDSPWLTLRERDNVLKTYGATPDDGCSVLIYYGYRAAWWGI